MKPTKITLAHGNGFDTLEEGERLDLSRAGWVHVQRKDPNWEPAMNYDVRSYPLRSISRIDWRSDDPA